jgi:hypothetical protein
MEFESPQTHDPTNIDPFSTRMLYIADVAQLLRLSPATVQRMSTRKRNRLPLIRGVGRPRILEKDLYAYVQAQGQAEARMQGQRQRRTKGPWDVLRYL